MLTGMYPSFSTIDAAMSTWYGVMPSALARATRGRRRGSSSVQIEIRKRIPVAAGLAQGPGFPNLSCLGLLSDRILRRYVAPPEPVRTIQKRREHV